MTPARAADTLAVVVREPEPQRVTFGRMLMGPVVRQPPRREVLVVDRDTDRALLRIPVDGSEHEARALAAVLADDLARLDETAFLKRHARGNRHR